MFTTPIIPTDSLYKFLFVGGVVLIIAAFTLQLNQVDSNRSQLSKYDSLRMSIQIERTIKDNKITQTNNKLNNEKDSAMLEYISGRMDQETKYFDAKVKLLFTIVFLGFIMMVCGGSLWYRAIQTNQDKLLLIQVRLAEIDLIEKEKQLQQESSN